MKMEREKLMNKINELVDSGILKKIDDDGIALNAKFVLKSLLKASKIFPLMEPKHALEHVVNLEIRDNVSTQVILSIFERACNRKFKYVMVMACDGLEAPQHHHD